MTKPFIISGGVLAFIVCEFFLALFYIFDFSVYLLVGLEIIEAIFFFYFMMKLIESEYTKRFCITFLIGLFLINLYVFMAYLFERNQTIKYAWILLILYVVFLNGLNILFIKTSDLHRISLLKCFIFSLSSILLGLLMTYFRINLIKPSLGFLILFIKDFKFSDYIKIGILTDFSFFTEAFLLVYEFKKSRLSNIEGGIQIQ